ncbi:sulfotransferase family protein [Prochlorothrix hollandica]|uniref:Sulfotransferase family protein n=2 Tax=Prochlorothrix hollandica TaxID=1223 RepID=A0A0M2PVN1_PROHO|nr:sulfotransferase family protein [Prochlorothrix hollandica]KKI98733.1 hypothetical protein PROH_18030 [Prochlorothrix hollandica PCC 9006 = CALU 1027]
MSLQVIGAGMGRTGTLSLKYALEALGVGSCYHMMELLQDPSRVGYWEQAARGEAVDWDALFAGYSASVDYPTYRYYDQLLAYYPHAKVILTVRDPEQWYASASATIYQAASDPIRKLKLIAQMPFSPRVRKLVKVLRLAVQTWELDFAGRFEDKAYALDCFQRHIETVQAQVPPDRLLVYDISQGWEPLTQFLGLPVPDQAFPWVNQRSQFASRADLMINTPKD